MIPMVFGCGCHSGAGIEGSGRVVFGLALVVLGPLIVFISGSWWWLALVPFGVALFVWGASIEPLTDAEKKSFGAHLPKHLQSDFQP